MAGLASARCFNHARREAAARCPSCRRYYCRECVSEHEGRVLCARCLRIAAGSGRTRTPPLRKLLTICLCAFGLVLAWLFFYAAGQILLRIPATFHDGTMWTDRP